VGKERRANVARVRQAVSSGHVAACADGSGTAFWREPRARPNQDDLPIDAVRWSWRSSAEEQGLEERHGRRGVGIFAIITFVGFASVVYEVATRVFDD
jgi:hypothetical protein